MATVAVTTKNEGLKGQYVTVLALVGSTADVSNPIDISKFSRGSIQAAGTFGTTTFTVQVSNDGSAWATAKDPLGNDVTFTAAGLKYINMGARYLRLTAPSGTGTGLNAYLNLGY